MVRLRPAAPACVRSATAAACALAGRARSSPLTCKPCVRSQASPGRPASKGGRNTLLVSNLPSGPPDVLQAELKKAFGRYGELRECARCLVPLASSLSSSDALAPLVCRCEVLRDGSGGSRGWAFVRLQDARDTEHAKRELDGTSLALPTGRAGSSEPPKEGGPGKPGLLVRWSLDKHTLCVRDLGPGVTDQQLQDAFEQFGNIVSCRVEKTPPEFHSRSKVS